MDNRSLAYASYWRNSLADAELGRGALSQRDISGLSRIPVQELFKGVMPADLIYTDLGSNTWDRDPVRGGQKAS